MDRNGSRCLKYSNTSGVASEEPLSATTMSTSARDAHKELIASRVFLKTVARLCVARTIEICMLTKWGRAIRERARRWSRRCALKNASE